jgi:hypothetical protein
VKTKVIAKGVAGIRRVEYQCFPLKAGMALTILRTACSCDKLIKQVGNPVRDNWIEQEYHWRRKQLGQAVADEFMREYDQ